jgi:hypothetical protein
MPTNSPLKCRRGSRNRGGPFSVFLLLLIWPLSLVAAAQPAAQKAAATTVGSDTCSACHDEVYKAFQKNPHAVVEKDKRRG